MSSPLYQKEAAMPLEAKLALPSILPQQQPNSLNQQQPNSMHPHQQRPHQQPSAMTPHQQPSAMHPHQQPTSMHYNPQPTSMHYNQQPISMQYNQQPSSMLYNQQPSSMLYNQQPGSMYNPQHPSSLYHQQQPSAMNQIVRSDRNMLSMSDDTMMMAQIQATHAPDGREVNVKPLLSLVEDILSLATINTDPLGMGAAQKQEEDLEDKTSDVYSMLETVSYTIDKVSCEIAYKALGGTDAHATTLSLCNLLSSYPWDCKLVLSLAAFALNYGEFWLLAQIYTTNQLAKSMAQLKQLPAIMEHAGQLKPRFDALNNLIHAMLDVTRVIVQFKELPAHYISQNNQAMSTAINHIPTAVYWTIRSIVACATQITIISTTGPEHITSTTEAWELSTLVHKLKTIHDHLQKQLHVCLQYIEGKMDHEAFEMLLGLFQITHIDNMKILKALLNPREVMAPLYDAQTKQGVNIDVLRRKNVLLLITGPTISHEELSILEQIYNESREHADRLHRAYDVVWVPVMDPSAPWTEEMQDSFKRLQSTMSWYTVHHPSIIEKHVIRFIKEVWHFRNKPILVVLDPQGRVVCPNAIHMMWIWGSTAFPFTTKREDALWKEEIWRLELLVDGIDPTILNWIREDKYIFLYGGSDIEWARKFTKEAKSVALDSRVPLEMIYVGKSTAREKVKKAIATITMEKLSDCWQDMTMIWFFWIRLESMLFSKMQLGIDDIHDPIMREIKKLISYDKEGGWAILAKGSRLVVNGYSTNVLATLTEYEMWKENIKEMGFDPAFRAHHDKLNKTSHPCSRFELSTKGHGRIPEGMKCPECLRNMEKFITFLCCHDEPVTDFFNPINDLE